MRLWLTYRQTAGRFGDGTAACGLDSVPGNEPQPMANFGLKPDSGCLIACRELILCLTRKYLGLH